MGRNPSTSKTPVPKVKKKKSLVPDANSHHSSTEVKFCDMNEDQRKQYNRQKQKISREKRKLVKELDFTETAVPFVEENGHISKKKKVEIGGMTGEEKKEYNRQRQKISREKQKLNRELVFTDMLVQCEDRNENSAQCHKKEHCEKEVNTTYDDSKRTPNVVKSGEENDGAGKKIVPNPAKKDKKADTDCKETEFPGNPKNCKIRLGFIDIREAETDAIVFPLWKKDDKYRINDELTKVLSSDEMNTQKSHLSSLSWTSKLDNFEVVEADLKRRSKTNDLKSQVDNIASQLSDETITLLHVLEPSFSDCRSKFSMATEAHLRAAYLSCLMKCDQSQYQSVAFPILGNGICQKTSIAIGIQTVFAYMQATRESSLELVYFVTSDSELYDELGQFLFYIREIDLSQWERKLYFEFEQRIFDLLQPKKYFSTIPGTDMIWRCIKLTVSGKARMYLEEAKFVYSDNRDDNDGCFRKIHDKISIVTGVESEFKCYAESKTRGRKLGNLYIRNGFLGSVTCFNYLRKYSEMSNFCGSNHFLRRLWIVSRYYMYGWNTVSDANCFDSNSEEFKKRKQAFFRLKGLHRHVRKLWIRIEKYAPHSCACLLADGTHENLMVFITKMSHSDPIFDMWILHERKVLHCQNSDETLKSSPIFIHGKSTMEEVDNLQNKTHKMMSSAEEWYSQRKEWCKRKNDHLKTVIDELGLNDDSKTKNEMDPNSYDALVLNNAIDYGEYDENWRDDLTVLFESEQELELSVTEEKRLAAAKRTKQCESWIKFKNYERHTEEDLKIEMMLRNRQFRQLSYTEDPEAEWESEDDQGNVNLLSVEEYLLQKKCTSDIPIVSSQEVFDEEEVLSNTPIIPAIRSYPEPVSLGKRDVACAFCNALSFKDERLEKCCQNGAVWIAPFRKLPIDLRAVFSKKHRKYLLSTNAAFSMASISYNRLQQAPGGIQSMKINGLMSFHPSAVHPRQKNHPRFANFIVLEHGNEEIAKMRFAEMIHSEGELSDLKKIFFDIQHILDTNNIFYHQFKSMIELEKQFMKENNGVEVSNKNLQFRIVPTSDLNLEDLKALPNHKGVYADLNRIGDGYITVAYTWNSEDSTVVPRGLNIYPKNPQKGYQLPISIFSDLCELLCYPLMFPFGEGGWGLKKYKRYPAKSRKPMYEVKKKEHIAELKRQGKDPQEYYIDYNEEDTIPMEDLDDDLENLHLLNNSAEMMMRNSLSEITDKLEDEPMDYSFADDPKKDMNTEPAVLESESEEEQEDKDDDGEDYKEEDEEKEVEKEALDPSDLDLNSILLHGKLEDEQEYPIDGSVGQRPNFRMEQRNGEMIPILNQDQRLIEIAPFANPFEFDDDGDYGRGDRVMDPVEEYASDDGEFNDIALEIEPNPSNEEDENLVETNGDFDLNGDEFCHEDDKDGDDEDVCYGDEDVAEDTEVGRRNDGVKIKNVGQRTHVSVAEYGTYIGQERNDTESLLHGKAQILGQLSRIDLALKMREQRAKALLTHRAEFGRSINRSKVFEFTQKTVHKNLGPERNVGLLMTMPSTAPGSTKYQRELVMSAITMANRLGRPHVFVTFTGNSKWKEIRDETARLNCEWADIPEFVCSAFNTRFEMFCEDVLGKKVRKRNNKGKYDREPGIYGTMKWFNYSVEYQQRGMPHVHMLICLKEGVTTTAEVDRIISAEIPEYPEKSDPNFDQKLRLYKLVVRHMIHTPCEGDSTTYCNADKKGNHQRCKKGFPHPFAEETTLRNNEYPIYKRTPGRTAKVKNKHGKIVPATSQWVVPYCPFLLMKYETHINVEIVSTIKSIKYIFKYIHKGADRVLLEACENLKKNVIAPDSMTLHGNIFAPHQMDPGKVQERKNEANKLMDAAGVSPNEKDRLTLNESHYALDLSAMTACEAAWKLAGRKMHGSSHHVHRLYVHEEGNETFFIRRGLTHAKANALLNEEVRGMMEAWFRENRNPKELPGGKTTTDLTMPEMTQYYSFNMTKQEFSLRKKDYSEKTFGRIQSPPPYLLELTATRLLAMNVKGPKNWEELRTYKGHVYKTCLEAARERRLMNGEKEWDDLLKELSTSANPFEIRRVFVSILLNCAPVNPLELFLNNMEPMMENKKSWSEEEKLAHALRHVQFLLGYQKMSLAQFELDALYNEKQLPKISNDVEYDNPEFDPVTTNEHKLKGQQLFAKLNSKQNKFVERVIQLASQPRKSKLVFVSGPGGTGKTFCYTTIYHLLKAKNQTVACVAHTGIAASLLPFGCTAHRTFSIPLEVSDRMVCRVTVGTAEADQLKNINVLIWDEASMTDRRIYDAVDILFQDLFQNSLPFGGITVVFGGDWRQILPIVENVRGEGVLEYILKNSLLWKQMEMFELTDNQRAITDPEFANFVLSIGNGDNYVDKKRKLMVMPEKYVERGSEMDLINWVFPDVNNVESTQNASVLTIDNRTALRVNQVVLSKLRGEERIFVSEDTSCNEKGLTVDPEVFASQTPQGMPEHILRLKKGAQVVLLRNLSVKLGLCNGTRLTVKSFDGDIIHCTVNNKLPNTPDIVLLHRIRMAPSGKGAISCGFTRLQYPIRLAYSSTVNKCQGQTLAKCGLLLNTPVFTHGMLYVAISRVKTSENFRVWHFKRNTPDDFHYSGGILLRNVVYKDVFKN